jgi:hypothetical protein
MPLVGWTKSYSLTDLKVATVAAGTEAWGTLVDVPGIRSMEVAITTDSEELRGDSTILAVVDKGNGCEFTLEEGGVSLEALAVMLGPTIATTGTTPAQVNTWTIKSTDNRPYFGIIGQALADDNVSDLHVAVLKAKLVGNVSFTFADEAFATPTMEGQGVGRATDSQLLRIIQHETKIPLAAPTLP